MATIFSKIIAGEIPCYKVAEDEKYFAFLDIAPLAKGHTLVVPKCEVDYLFDLDDETLSGMTLFAKRVAAQIKSVTGCKKVAVPGRRTGIRTETDQRDPRRREQLCADGRCIGL